MKLRKAPRFHHTQLQHFSASQCSEMVSYGKILHESHCKTPWGFSRLVKTLWLDRIYSETLIHGPVIPKIFFFHLYTPKHFMRGCIYFYSWVYYTSNILFVVLNHNNRLMALQNTPRSVCWLRQQFLSCLVLPFWFRLVHLTTTLKNVI